MAVDNNTIIGDFLLRNTNDAQQLGLTSTMQGLSQGMQQIFDPYKAGSSDIYNHFCDWLIKVPAMQYTRSQSFKNRLGAFVKKLPYGGSVLENQVGWVKEHNYDVTDSKLLKMYYPEGLQAYHQQNRQGKFPVSLSMEDLKTAFTSETGLNELAAQISQSPINSDELQTYQYMKQLLAEYDNYSPIYTIHHDTEPNTVEGAQLLLAEMVAWAEKLQFPSSRYNATAKAGHAIATFEKPENMVLMVTPELYGFYKVLGLGLLFHRDEAETPFRVVVMDEFPMPGVFAVLCSEDWFQCYDTEYRMVSFFDGDTLTTQYRLHHWQVLSTSPFAPIIAFGTREQTAGSVVTVTPNGVTIVPATTTVDAGGTVALDVNLTGDITPATDGVEVKPDSVVWTVTAADSKGAAVELNTRTRITADNVLHVQRTLASGTVLTLAGVTTWVNPSGTTEKYTATATVTVK